MSATARRPKGARVQVPAVVVQPGATVLLEFKVPITNTTGKPLRLDACDFAAVCRKVAELVE